MKLNRHAVMAGAIVLASCAAWSTSLAASKGRAPGKLPRYGMVVYSDLCIYPDSGEFGGQRITLQRFAEVDTVLYEYTAGGLSWPLVATDVTIDPRGQQFYFTVQPPEGEERTISGKLADNGKTLVLDGGYCDDESVPMRLSLVTDFSRKAGVCRACPAPKKKKKEEEVPPEEPKPAQDTDSTATAGL